MKNNGTKQDLSKPHRGGADTIRDALDIIAVVGVASGAVCVFVLVVAFAVSSQ